jgi:hypothetical protein
MTTPTNPIIEPIERSMPPERMTKVVGEDVAENQRREEVLVQKSSDQEQRQEDSDRRDQG